MGCNCSKKKLAPVGKRPIKKTSQPKRMSVKPTRRIVRRTTR